MSEIRDILNELESCEKPDTRQIESLLYMYADMPDKFDGKMNGAELFDELTRLAVLCKRSGLPDEVQFFCYKKAFASHEPDPEQFKKYGIPLIDLYLKLHGSHSPGDDDNDCIRVLSELLKKYRYSLLAKRSTADMLEVYEAGLSRMLYESLPAEKLTRSVVYNLLIQCSRAGFNKTVTEETALGFFKTVDTVYFRFFRSEFMQRPEGGEQEFETVVESIARAYEGMADMLPEKDWGTSIVYYKLALEIRLRYLDRVFPADCGRGSLNRFGRLRLILTQMIPEADIVSEFAEGFYKLQRAYKGIRSEDECSQYRRLSDEFYGTIVDMCSDSVADTEAAPI